MRYSKEQINNIDINYLKTKKFNSITLNIRFLSEFKEEDIEYRILLPRMLSSNTVNFKNKIAISKYLESLYGSSFSSSVLRRGNLSIIDFTISFVDPKLILDNKIYNNIFKFLNEIIYNHKAFDEIILNEERNLLLDDIKLDNENKFYYAKKNFFKHMFSNEKYGVDLNGNLEKLKNITAFELYEYYKNIFLNDLITINIIGDIKKYTLNYYINKYFKQETNYKLNIIDNENKFTGNVKKIVEKTNINQNILVVGFRTNIYSNKDLFYPFLVGNGILGGYMHSKLFKNIREKESLCYTISNYQDSYKGILFIESACKKEDISKLINLIIKQVEDIKNNKFSLNDLNMTKRLLENDLKELEDLKLSMVNRMFYSSLLDINPDINYAIKKIKNVNKEDVINAFKNVILDTIYILEGENNEV